MAHALQQKCEACRISNKSCDWQRPKCGECVANSVVCVYQSDDFDFTFVDQNDFAANASHRAAHRRARKSNKRTPIALDLSLLERSRTTTAGEGQPTQLAPPILHTLDDRVLHRFFSRWAARLTCLGCLDSIPDLFEASGRDSAIQTAILATAYADLTVFERHGDRGMQSHQAYLKTLRRLQIELSNPNFVAGDGILAAILTIDAFELLYMGRAEPLGVHTEAMARLLELRRDDIVAHNSSYTLWRSAYQRIYVRQMFCEVPSLAIATLSASTIEIDNHPEVRTIRFVAGACDALSQLQNERAKPPGDISGEKITQLCTALRTLMQEAHTLSENNGLLPQSRRVPFDVQTDPELREAFSKSTVIVYDNFTIARDRLFFTICCIKILDTLIELRTESFSSRHSTHIHVEAMRTFLLEAQPDLTVLHEKCRFALDIIPLLLGLAWGSSSCERLRSEFTTVAKSGSVVRKTLETVVGLVSPNGIVTVGAWVLNDTGVLSVKSPLKTIAGLEYGPLDIKSEANCVLKFLDAHRHVLT